MDSWTCGACNLFSLKKKYIHRLIHIYCFGFKKYSISIQTHFNQKQRVEPKQFFMYKTQSYFSELVFTSTHKNLRSATVITIIFEKGS
ncbi:hypothetical protein HanRHA438_Chr03g0118051 [Helianthus annuus]|nr:hypothetical protein HanRHA438_Chr03g0118051 [Helianthus annuus]